MSLERLEKFTSVALALAAFAMVGIVAEQRLRRPDQIVIQSDALNLYPVDDWKRSLAAAVPYGVEERPLTVVVVSDLECPACKSFHELLSEIVGTDSSVAAHELLIALPQHRFAGIASRAVECSRASNRHGAMRDAVYRYQDSLGLKPWREIAGVAGQPHVGAWERCLRANHKLEAVAEASRFAQEIGVRATPTVIVNGLRLSRTPTRAELLVLIDSLRTATVKRR